MGTFYKMALSSTELSNVYSHPCDAPDTTNLKLWLPLKSYHTSVSHSGYAEGSYPGSTIKDYSKYGATGTYVKNTSRPYDIAWDWTFDTTYFVNGTAVCQWKDYKVADGYRFAFNGKEKDDETYGEGDEYDYGMRMYDARVGRFLSVDPITKKFSELTPYQFASNTPIMAIDLDGEEAKVAIAGQGDLKDTHYTASDITSFWKRTKNLKGFSVQRVSSGKEIINSLINETKLHGSISTVVSFSHAGYDGLFLNNNNGLYTTGVDYKGTDQRTVQDIVDGISSGKIKFEKNATWIFDGCNVAYNGGTNQDFAFDLTSRTGITTIGGSGYVGPEIVDGKETGKLTTTGTFYKFKKTFTASIVLMDMNGDPYTSESTFDSKEDRNKYVKSLSKAVRNGTADIISTGEKIERTDLGKTIDPSKQN